MTSALVVGAGLGGLTAACRLAEQGVSVTVLEAARRAGGKSGASEVGGRRYDHGWHGFPGWYVNTRALLSELGVHLVDFDRATFIDPLPAGGLERPATLFLPTSLAGLLRVIRGGFLPPAHTILYLYYLLDTIAAPLGRKDVLDRISRTALMRDRWYATDLIVAADSDSLLKGTAIPGYRMSAMTWKTVLANWVRSPVPFMAVLPGDMQTKFIDPLLARARSLGVTVLFEERVESFHAAPGRVTGLASVDAAGVRTERVADYYLMAAPLEVARRIMGWDLQEQDPGIGELQHLTVVPMGSLHVTLTRRVAGIPRGPVFFKGGRYALSFVDLSQIGAAPPDRTSLSFVTSNSVELVGHPPEVQLAALMSEVTAYTGITMADVDAWHVIPNVDAPLAVNDVQAWPHRPEIRSARLHNLLYACDWARTPVDLCCMEGAVFAGLEAARRIAADMALALPAPAVAPQYPRGWMRALTWLLYPLVPCAWAWARCFEDGSTT